MTTVKLNSGYECPILGYGTWQSTDAEKLKEALKAAIHAGYRHIDTAWAYQNEGVIGETLQELYDAKVIKREDLYLTTKVFPNNFHPDLLVETLKGQLEKLKTTYVDLYLLHFPVPFKHNDAQWMTFGPDGNVELDMETKLEDTWRAMEKCVELGMTRSIGVSNFNIKQIERMLNFAKIKPAMNQVESHPAFQNNKLMEFCQKHGVQMTAYSSFGSPGSVNPVSKQKFSDMNLLEDPKIIAIAEKYNKTPAQAILRWQIQRNVVVIPKSLTPSRVAENFNVWDFKLTDEDMAAFAAMDLNKRVLGWVIPGVEKHPEFPFVEEGSC